MPIKSEKIIDVLPFFGILGCIFKRKTKQTVQQSTLCICKSWLVQLELQDHSNLCQIPGQNKYTDRNGSQDGHASSTELHLKHGGMQRSKTHCQYNQPFLFKAQTQIAHIMRINTSANLERCVWRERELCRSGWKMHKSMWLFKYVTAVWS